MEFEKIKLPSESSEPEFDFDKVYNECLVDLDLVLDAPPMALSIGKHEYGGNYYDTPAHTLGEFSATVAPSKTKKTYYKSALIAGFIGGTSQNYFPIFKTHRASDEDIIIDIDTEQGKFYSQRVFRRVSQITGMKYDNYYPFAMRSKTPEERVMFVDMLLQQPKFKGKVKFISIDGIADLIEDTNDIIMSAKIASKVLKWTDEEGAHLHTVIHKLHNVDKPTGHLGSYILKKAETVVFLSVNEEDPNVIDVTHKYARGVKFDDFSFEIDKDGLPVMIERLERQRENNTANVFK